MRSSRKSHPRQKIAKVTPRPMYCSKCHKALPPRAWLLEDKLLHWGCLPAMMVGKARLVRTSGFGNCPCGQRAVAKLAGSPACPSCIARDSRVFQQEDNEAFRHNLEEARSANQPVEEEEYQLEGNYEKS